MTAPATPFRKKARVLRAALLGGLLFASAALPNLSYAAIVERVVAIVGERAILLSDLRERALPFLVRVYQSVPEGPQRTAAINQVYGVVLDRMIEEELEDTAAQKMGLTISSQEIDDAIARVAGQNNLSKNALLAEAKRSGLSIPQYRDEVRRQLLQSKISSVRLQGRVHVTEADLKAAYRLYLNDDRLKNPTRTVRLVLSGGRTPEEQSKQLAKANAIVRRARAGEDLSGIIAVTPSLPGTGVAPTRAPAEEPEPISKAIIALELGEVSQPIHVGDQLVILQVLERGPSELPEYEEALEQLQQRVYMEKMAKARTAWLASLRRRTHVERKL